MVPPRPLDTVPVGFLRRPGGGRYEGIQFDPQDCRKTDDSQSGTRPVSWPGIKPSNHVFRRGF